MTVTIVQADTLHPSDNSYADHVVRPNYWIPVVLPQSLEHQMNAERKWYSEDPSYTLDWTCTLRMNKQSKYHIPVPTPVYDWVQS